MLVPHFSDNKELTEIEEGLPLVSLSGQLVGTHELLELSPRDVFQDVLTEAKTPITTSMPSDIFSTAFNGRETRGSVLPEHPSRVGS